MTALETSKGLPASLCGDRCASPAARSLAHRCMALTLLLAGACRDEPSAPAAASASTVPLDRLAQDEVLPDTPHAFGLELPPSLRVTARFDDVVQAEGTMSLERLIEHFKQRVHVAAIELSEQQAIFPRVYIRGDERKRTYRIVISTHGKRSRVRITDVTGAPTVQGLSEAERWERAGHNPDGSLKNRLQVY